MDESRSDSDSENAAPGSVGPGRVLGNAPGSKSRHYCFTWNNYPIDWRLRLDELGASYYFIGGEVGASGTPHLQGVISFTNPRSFSAVCKYVRGWHIEVMRGTIDQAIAYCSKEETRDPDFGEPVEFGTRPICAGKPGGRSDLQRVAADVRAGSSISDIADKYPVSVILFNRGIERLINLRAAPRDFQTLVKWYHGPTGSGKTRAASTENPGAYWKSPSNQWWCGYDSHEAVIIDDYRTDFCKFNVLLRLFDRYPMKVEVKGGTVEFRPKVIVVTAPKSPTEMWNLRSDEDLKQLTRRISEIKFFPFGV